MTPIPTEDHIYQLDGRVTKLEAHNDHMLEDVKYLRSRVGWIVGLALTVLLGTVPSLAILAYQVTIELPELKQQVRMNQRTLWRKIEGETDRLTGTPSEIPLEELERSPDYGETDQ